MSMCGCHCKQTCHRAQKSFPCRCKTSPTRNPNLSPTRIERKANGTRLCSPKCICSLKSTDKFNSTKRPKSPQFPTNVRNPRILTTDLQLFDENCHLIGYIKEGSIIEEPSCPFSCDPIFEKNSYFKQSENTRHMYTSCCRECCLSSCKYANELKSSNPSTGHVPRWTPKSSYQQAVKPKKITKKCYC
uniref:Uncharacterized protein n=1 Tax=Clastoptera arizonana TaxID=38151 RepID=A0A1B6DNM5_9HEMI